MGVQLADPPNALVLLGSLADMGVEEGWELSTGQYVVNPGPDSGSRILPRGRYNDGPDWKSRLANGGFLLESLGYVTSRKTMLEIKRLAERDT